MEKYACLVVSLFLTSIAFAQESQPSQQDPQQPIIQQTTQQQTVAPIVEVKPLVSSRKGLIIGAGVGGGGIHIGSGRDFNKPGLLGGLRVAGGLTENFMIMGETFSSWTKDNGVTTTISTINFSAQWFCFNNLYVRPGIGISMLSASSKSGKIRTTYESDSGISAIGAVGYEFRIERGVGISPEIYFNYDHVDNANMMNYGGVIAAMFYL